MPFWWGRRRKFWYGRRKTYRRKPYFKREKEDSTEQEDIEDLLAAVEDAEGR